MGDRLHLLYAEDSELDADLTRAHFEQAAADFELTIVDTASACGPWRSTTACSRSKTRPWWRGWRSGCNAGQVWSGQAGAVKARSLAMASGVRR